VALSDTVLSRLAGQAIDHHLECIEIMDQTGSRDLKIWLADGMNYPGQGDIRGRQDRLADSLRVIYDRLGAGQRLVLAGFVRLQLPVLRR
jgi:L-rhamnose isomerase / sugar isomerase